MDSEYANATTVRVEQHTPPHINERLRWQIEASVVYHLHRLDQIEQRLNELDREWDMDRVLQAHSSLAGLMGMVLGLFWSRTRLLSALAAGFLLMHATQGWAPPSSVFRRLGVRTRREISHERYALKALRGDFREVGPEAQGDTLAKVRKAIEAAGYR